MGDNPSTPVVDHPVKGAHPQDPSPLVIQMVQREVAQLQQHRVSELEGLRRELITRLDAMDKALRKVEQYPTDVDMAVARAREFFEEKFRSVGIRFDERDKRFTLREEDNKELLREQRLSSETAINKAEGSMLRELETLKVALRDMKERMDRTEGKTEGEVKLWGIIVSAVMVVSAIFGIAAVVMTRGAPV